MGWKNPLTGSLKSRDSGPLRKIFESIENYFTTVTPAGVIMHWAGTTVPNEEWLLCDGTAVSRLQYPQLFKQLSTSFGAGDGTTTFNVPDLRGRVPVVLDNLGGSDSGRLTVANTLGGSGGEQNHILLTAELPSHTHTVFGVDSTVLGGTNAFGVGQMAQASSTRNATTAPTGSGTAHNVMQPYLLLGAIIKT